MNPSSTRSPSVETEPAAAGFRPPAPAASTVGGNGRSPVRNPPAPVKRTQRAYDGASSKRNTWGAVARSGVRYAKHLARLEGTLSS